MTTAPPTPADLAACDREPIHLLGSVQPPGCLLALTPAWTVAHASANLEHWTSRPVQQLLGTPADELLDREAEHAIRGRLHLPSITASVERLFGLPLVEGGAPCDLGVHRAGELTIVEAEPADASQGVDITGTVVSMIAQLQQAPDLQTMHERAVRHLRVLTGFDRVIVYRFDHEQSGEVIAEATRPGVDGYLGLHFPASDIPRQARALYERNLLRLIADVDAAPVPILSAPGSAAGGPIDLSLALHRSVSSVHLQYLRNMGVRASMSVSILVDGRLWGLFACHHLAPRRLNLPRRTAVELFGRMFSLLLESRERQVLLAQDAQAQAAKDRLLASIDPEQDTLDALERFAQQLRELIPCAGTAVSYRSRIRANGLVPPADALAGLVRDLCDHEPGHVRAIDELSRLHAPAAAWPQLASGVLALPISRAPCDYLLLLRPEQPTEVRWAGNPEKPAEPGEHGLQLSPRKSFETWCQSVRGRSAPWTEAQVRLAESLRLTLLEVVLRRSDAAERERQRAQQHQEVLIAELNHRVRNLLALIGGLIARTREGAASVEGFASALGSRIQALGRAHDQLTAQHAGPAPLRALIEAELQSYAAGHAQRVTVGGPAVLLQSQALTTMALVVHELATNAVKYGALGARGGCVHIDWRLEADGALALDWVESGGPPVRAPERAGFGTTVIERTVPHELGGTARLDYRPDGLHAAFTIPARFVTAGPTDATAAATKAPDPGRPLDGRSVLLVEDNLLIALAGEDALAALGARHVEIASSVADALAALSRMRLDAAVLDVDLGNQTSVEVAHALDAQAVPYVFTSGYDQADALPEALRQRPMVRKPYDRSQLGRAIGQALAAAQAGSGR